MRLVSLLALAAALSTTPALAQTRAPEVRQVGSATLTNVPAIPADVAAAVQRYQNYRAAMFQDWLADGSMLITTRFGATNQLHRVAAPGADRTQLTFFAEPVAGAFAIPDANRFVLGRDTGGDEWFQLYAMGLTGEPVALTEPGTRNEEAVFTGDGKRIAWTQAVENASGRSIVVADVADPASRRVVFRAEDSWEPADFSADGRSLLLIRSLSNRESELYQLSLAGGAAQPVRIAPTASARLYLEARYTPQGKVLAISDGDGDVRRLVEIDPATGQATVLTPDLRWDVENFDLTDDGRVLAYVVNEDGLSRVVVQDRVTRRALPQPELPKGVVIGFGFDKTGGKLAIGLSTATSAGDVWSWDVNGGGLTRWTTSELGGLNPARLAEPTLVRFRSFDGLSVPAFVYRPKGVAANVRTPVIIDIHGGPEAQTRPQFNAGAQYFADVLGATVILPNVRGSDGYGRRYLNLDNAEKREDSVKDIGALLDWIATQPGLDAGKVAVYGQSYGGYMSLASMVHYSDRLVGGVERYGISDWSTFLNNTEAYRRANRRAEYGDERTPEMQAVFRRISPMNNVAKITKPMLVMQGANDPRVPQSESDQIVARLTAQGVPVSYVLFADEGHGFLKKPNNDLRREVETVFLRDLFGAPPR